MIHNPLYRVSKLRRELAFLRTRMPDNFDVAVSGKRMRCFWRDGEFAFGWWVIGDSINHRTEERALKSAVRIARKRALTKAALLSAYGPDAPSLPGVALRHFKGL